MKIGKKMCLRLIRAFVIMWMMSCLVCIYVIEHVERQRNNTINNVAIHKHVLDSCPENTSFSGTFHENILKLEQNKFPKSEPWIRSMGFHRSPARVVTSFPVIVTASDSQFFIRSQGLVKSVVERVMKKNKHVRFIYYNLGLKSLEIDLLKKHCRCEVRNFPFDKVPDHVRSLSVYAFKPVIVNMVYKEFGHVWWVDASVRFVSGDLHLPVKYLREYNTLFFTHDKVLNIALHSLKATFKHFSEDPCLYKQFGEIEAGNIAFRKSHVADVVLRQWVSCALDIECIAPANATKNCGRKLISEMTDDLIGHCHRYDQSALSIILRRLYHKQNNYPLVTVPFGVTEVQRRDIVYYFS